MKAERVSDGRRITDTLDGESFVHGQQYMVEFPDGTRKKMPAIVSKQMLVQTDDPFLITREQTFFAVQHCGLKEIWCRAIDLPDIQKIDVAVDAEPDAPVPMKTAPRKRKQT